jgi:hypothetical protein
MAYARLMHEVERDLRMRHVSPAIAAETTSSPVNRSAFRGGTFYICVRAVYFGRDRQRKHLIRR